MKALTNAVHMLATGLVLILCQAAIAGPGRVEVVPFCVINELGVAAQTIVNARLEDSMQPDKEFLSRYFFRVECSRQTRQCKAVRFNLGNIEKGASIQMLDVVIPENMRLVTVQERIATIWWPRQTSGVAITIDLDKKRFEFKSTGALGHDNGEGECPTIEESEYWK